MAIFIRNEEGILKPLEIAAIKGKDGITPNLTVGEVAALDPAEDPTVSITGDKENPVLNFGIPVGGVQESDKVDYMGNPHETLKDTNDANVEYVLGEVNTVNYEGQQITATNTFEKQVKRAILKGNTKKMTINGVVIEDNYTAPILECDKIFNHNNGVLSSGYAGAVATDFLICPKVDFKLSLENFSYPRIIFYDNNKEFLSGIMPSNGQTITPHENAKYIRISNSSQSKIQLADTNGNLIDICSELEGVLQSVKMPVLTTTGKNLIGECINPTERHKKYKPFLKPETSYTLNYKNSNGSETSYGRVYLLNGETNSEITSFGYAHCLRFTTPTNVDDTTLLCIDSWNNELSVLLVEGEEALNIDLEKILEEPYKSTSLSTPQDLVLHGIGDVKDELDLVTGELAQRIGEVVLDGTTDNLSWFRDAGTTHTAYWINFDKPLKSTNKDSVVCDKLPVITSGWTQETNSVSIYSTTQGFITIAKEELDYDYQNTNAIIKYLLQNPITIQYQLATPIIKTVDLKGQKVYSYDGTTHYICSSADGSLVPTLNIDVPTNLSALVARQHSTIETQKDQIITLENNNVQQDELINTTMLATDEMFMMIEPLLFTQLLDLQGNSYMVNMYAAMIKRGLKTIDQVPNQFQEQVRARLEV